jgi:membrane protein DedA with SNARE-associated domain/rhodanese-related sulfurtransferase
LQHIAPGAESYGLLIIFLNALLAQAGLPLPAFPILMIAGALSQTGGQILGIIGAGFSGSVIADLAWYWSGKRLGQRVMRLLCKMSLSPDLCVRHTETMFLKVGPWSLLFAKVFPALSTISVAMAGATKMPLVRFLALDVIGTLAFVSAAVAVGRIFQDEVTDILLVLSNVGKRSIWFVLAIFILYLLARWWRRRLFIRQLAVGRITVEELRMLIREGRTPLILDVRPKGLRAQEGIIPGAVAAPPDEIDAVVANYPHDSEIVLYCACPNEASAAIAAKRLQRAGFSKIRPLLGGIDAWVEAGQPLARPFSSR